MENNVIDTNKNKNLIIGVMACIIVLLIAALVYFIFIKKDKFEEPVKPQDNQQTINNQDNDNNIIIIDNNVVKQIALGEINQTVRINSKNINLKVIDDTLYVNDIKQDDVMLEGMVFATNKYILIAGVGQIGYGIDYAVDENGKIINVYKSVVLPSTNYDLGYQINNMRSENGRVVADIPVESYCYGTEDNECDDGNIKVEFVYDGNNIIVKNFSLPENTKALTSVILNKTNKEIQFNNKKMNMKIVNSELYINDNKIKSIDYETAGVFVSDKMIFVYWLGGQCRGGVLIGAINTNNEFISIDTRNYTSIYGIYQQNDKIFGYSEKKGTDEYCGGDVEKVELVYNGKNVVIKKAS